MPNAISDRALDLGVFALDNELESGKVQAKNFLFQGVKRGPKAWMVPKQDFNKSGRPSDSCENVQGKPNHSE